jgi:hypothetical protein
MADEPLYKKFVTKYNGVEVYPNRVIISTGAFAKTEQTILIKSITGVDLQGPAKFLHITTQGGKVYKETFMAGKIAEEVYKVIMPML